MRMLIVDGLHSPPLHHRRQLPHLRSLLLQLRFPQVPPAENILLSLCHFDSIGIVLVFRLLLLAGRLQARQFEGEVEGPSQHIALWLQVLFLGLLPADEVADDAGLHVKAQPICKQPIPELAGRRQPGAPLAFL